MMLDQNLVQRAEGQRQVKRDRKQPSISFLNTSRALRSIIELVSCSARSLEETRALRRAGLQGSGSVYL